MATVATAIRQRGIAPLAVCPAGVSLLTAPVVGARGIVAIFRARLSAWTSTPRRRRADAHARRQRNDGAVQEHGGADGRGERSRRE